MFRLFLRTISSQIILIKGEVAIATFSLFARHGRALTGVSPEHAQIVGSV